MPKRRPKTAKTRTPLLLVVLAALTLTLFAGGELFSWSRADSGRLWIASHMGLGDRPHLVRLAGKQVHQALDHAGVPRANVTETVLTDPKGPALRWRVQLPREGSPLQLNSAITRSLEAVGGQVISGRETNLDGGGLAVTLMIGLSRRPTHELVLVHPGRDAPPANSAGDKTGPEESKGRVALVLFGMGEDATLTRSVCDRAEMFSVAVPAADARGRSVMKAARAAKREIVLQVPMEPERYPRVNPGPATLLVNMNPKQVESLARRYLKDADGVVAMANLMGEFATQDETFMRAVYAAVKRARMSFLHVQPAPRSVCRALASQEGVAYDEPDALLDGEAKRVGEKALDRSWDAALKAAREREHAIILLRVTPTSAAWLDRALAPKRLAGLTLVPLTQVIRRPAMQ
ncbi:MAG: divergent polysaccharide deacetylase family protein [Candidatus Eisenbacteria bacterium]